MVAAEAGVHYILINQGGWDHHAAIYGKDSTTRHSEDPKEWGGLYEKCAELDASFASLVAGLKSRKTKDGSASLLDKTFIVCTGQSGRTPGDLNDAKGRYHWPLARAIYPEDVTATIYSVLGIDWTKKISGMPPGRDFQ